MLEDAEHSRDANARTLAWGFLALVAVAFCLIVLGALVRANEAGLACPDWPLCFGEFIPQMDVKVAFEWSHRVLAGGVSLAFVALSVLVLRRPSTRSLALVPIAVTAVLLAVQIVLGALTVWKLLAAWTVTAHLLTGNAFAVALLWTGVSLREGATPPPARTAITPGARRLVALSAAVLVLQVALGGLVSSRFAGLACPEWPTCNGGVWFPTWGGTVGLHLLHRTNGYALLLALAAATAVVGIANVLLALPIEVTALHSALAAALVRITALAVREVWLSRPAALLRAEC
jgi:cytochrome c oxidase assembly protein subunit 15